MSVGVFFDGFSSTTEMLEVCREAEQAGASSLWFAQHMGYREALVWATAAASVTQRATLVPIAISPYLWPPLPVAMAISTLGEFAQGRVILNVSVGNILNLGGIRRRGRKTDPGHAGLRRGTTRAVGRQAGQP